MTLNQRDRERGAVAVLIAVMWTALFGMAVMAVDFGYLYTKKRGMQSAADGALKAAMPIFKSTGTNPAQTQARNVLHLSGYSDSEITFPTPGAGQFAVQVQRTHPTFFGGIFGIGPKTLTAISTGELTVAPGGAMIYASDNTACGGQWDLMTGIDIRGNGWFTVNGDVQTKNKVHFGNPNPNCNSPTACQVTGQVETGTGCNFWYDPPAAPAPGSVSYGGTSNGSPPDPINVAFGAFGAQCTVGTLGTAGAALPWNPIEVNIAGVWCNQLPSAIYCSVNPIDVIPPGPNASICPTQASFFSASNVRIQTNGTVTLSAHPNAPKGVIAYSFAAPPGASAILMTAGAGGTDTFTGKFYAPNGVVDFQSNTSSVTVSDTVAGKIININTGSGNWVFGTGGGPGPGSGWRVYR